MFLLVCVILFTGGGLCIMSLPVWLTGPMFLPGGSLSLVPCSFQMGGGLCPGGLHPGGSLSGRPPPPYGDERVVRILLESFLVMKMVSKMFFCKCVSIFHNSKIMSRGDEFWQYCIRFDTTFSLYRSQFIRVTHDTPIWYSGEV